jgi:hypothetical protein
MKCIYDDYPRFMGDMGCEGEVKLHQSMTAYHFEGEKNSAEDPNKDFYCCDAHYKEYEAFWQDMWDEYRASQGF